MKRFAALTEPTGETIPDPYEERRAALTAERQKARREEQDYAGGRRHGRRIWSWNDPWDKLFAAICVFPWAFAETSDVKKI